MGKIFCLQRALSLGCNAIAAIGYCSKELFGRQTLLVYLDLSPPITESDEGRILLVTLLSRAVGSNQ